MSELDEQMREASELNSMLATQSLDVDLDFDMEEELRHSMDEDKEETVTAVPEFSSDMKMPLPSVPESRIVSDVEIEDPSKEETALLLPVCGKSIFGSHSKSAFQEPAVKNLRQISRMII